MHLNPNDGQPRDVARPIVDMLFPEEQDGRIPIIAVTGTNGKTTTTRLIAHIMKEAGYTTGYSTTDGIYIGNQLVEAGDCTGPRSARVILKDRTVNCAVLECARGGILRGGLGFDQCDTAVITNIAEDHLGLKGIDSIEKLARVKAVVAEAAADNGFAVLNADDDNVFAIGQQLSCEIILFSMQAGHPRITKHVQNGGTAVTAENGLLTIIADAQKIYLGSIKDIPLTFSGKANFNIANTLAATAAAYSRGIRPAFIYQALLSFIPSDDSLPGRMNIFNFGEFTVVVDYAHNTHGLQCAGPFIQSMPASRRIGVIAGIGDRREEDIVSIGYESARVFDEIIIRHDADLRGRSAEELDEIVCRGIWKADPSKKVTIIPDEKEAVKAAIAQAGNGALAVIFADDVQGVIETVREAMPATDAIAWAAQTPGNASTAAA
jgi:cyanophycin synthetase